MPYNPALDGVRALSILAVVLFHCEVPGARGGFIGLDVFSFFPAISSLRC